MNCFIDSNIWLYIFIEGQDEDKAQLARQLVQRKEPGISTQIINEVCVNLGRQTDFSEHEIQELVDSFYRRYPVVRLGKQVMKQASKLRQHYTLSFWDSMIVSSALAADIKTLYSEDMQDGLEVENRLEIVNPF